MKKNNNNEINPLQSPFAAERQRRATKRHFKELLRDKDWSKIASVF